MPGNVPARVIAGNRGFQSEPAPASEPRRHPANSVPPQAFDEHPFNKTAIGARVHFRNRSTLATPCSGGAPIAVVLMRILLQLTSKNVASRARCLFDFIGVDATK